MDGKRARPVIGAALAAALVAGATIYLGAMPTTLRRVALYHAVFTELLPNSPDPGTDLDRLGLSRRDSFGTRERRPTTRAARSETRRSAQAFDERVGYPALARIYLSEPARIASVLRRAAWKGARMRPPFFGNFQKESGAPPRSMTRRFALWSHLKLVVRPWTLGLWTALLGGTAAAALATRRRSSGRGRLAREGLVVLCAMAALELAVCAFADAHLELVRHLYVFHALVDLVFVASAVWLVQAFSARRVPAPA